MADTALQIMTDIVDEMGLPRPASVTAAGTGRQLLAHMNATRREMIREVDWACLESLFVIEIGAPTEVSGTLVSGSAQVTIADTSAFSAAPYAFTVIGSGIQTGSRIVTVDSATTFTMDETATESGVVDLTIVRDTFALPADYKRMIPSTQWDRRFQWSLIGPQSPQLDQWQRSGVPVPVPRFQFRKTGALPTAFRIYPPPSGSTDYPGTLISEYISKYIVLSAAGVPKERFDANDDTPRDALESMLILGTKWRFRQAKGFDYADLQAEYYNVMDSEQSTDRGERVLPLSVSPIDLLISPWNVRDGNFPES